MLVKCDKQLLSVKGSYKRLPLFVSIPGVCFPGTSFCSASLWVSHYGTVLLSTLHPSSLSLAVFLPSSNHPFFLLLSFSLLPTILSFSLSLSPSLLPGGVQPHRFPLTRWLYSLGKPQWPASWLTAPTAAAEQLFDSSTNNRLRLPGPRGSVHSIGPVDAFIWADFSLLTKSELVWWEVDLCRVWCSLASRVRVSILKAHTTISDSPPLAQNK